MIICTTVWPTRPCQCDIQGSVHGRAAHKSVQGALHAPTPRRQTSGESTHAAFHCLPAAKCHTLASSQLQKGQPSTSNERSTHSKGETYHEKQLLQLQLHRLVLHLHKCRNVRTMRTAKADPLWNISYGNQNLKSTRLSRPTAHHEQQK